MKQWTPLHLHSHYSFLDGLSRPGQIAKVCEKYGYKSCALTDHGSVSGAVDFIKALQSKDIKPILGNELYINRSDATLKVKENGPRNTDHLVVLAKNKQGWLDLARATSRSNDDDVFYHKPRLDKNLLREFTGNLIAFSGHAGSALASVMFEGRNYSHTSLKSNALEVVCKEALEHQDIFGKGNFWIEIQRIDEEYFLLMKIINEILREASVKTGIPCIATADSHYPDKENCVDQRLLLCSAMKTTFKKVDAKLALNEEIGMGGFFKSDNYHIPSPEEMAALHTESEIEATQIVDQMCEDYSIFERPTLPKFDCPGGMSEADYLTELCRQGWRKRLQRTGVVNKLNQQVYVDRVKEELEIIREASLDGYFLIVQDYVNWAKNQGWLVGPSRGSAGGSLVSYLAGITDIDPVKYGLLFSRFYNPGRNTADRVSLPDIDMDFPKHKREFVFEYIRDKFGHNHVCQIATFGRLMGAGALTEVLKVHNVCDFAMSKTITRGIPHEDKISDQLESYFGDDDKSVIKWTLVHQPEDLQEYCTMKDDGSLEGPYASYFEQAIRLEGTLKNSSKHAAGLIVSPYVLSTVCPMIRDKSGSDKMSGFSGTAMEELGFVKLDVLGLLSLDKLMAVKDLLKYGEIQC